jgi:hypothetical protein
MSLASTPNARSGDRSDQLVVLGISAIAGAQLVTALLILLAPHWFFASVGNFGVYNGHYLGDAGTTTMGAGLGLLASLKWNALRAGALATNLAMIAAHAVNHWIDIGNANPGSSAGVFGAVSLSLLAGATAFVLKEALGREPA